MAKGKDEAITHWKMMFTEQVASRLNIVAFCQKPIFRKVNTIIGNDASEIFRMNRKQFIPDNRKHGNSLRYQLLILTRKGKMSTSPRQWKSGSVHSRYSIALSPTVNYLKQRCRCLTRSQNDPATTGNKNIRSPRQDRRTAGYQFAFDTGRGNDEGKPFFRKSLSIHKQARYDNQGFVLGQERVLPVDKTP